MRQGRDTWQTQNLKCIVSRIWKEASEAGVPSSGAIAAGAEGGLRWMGGGARPQTSGLDQSKAGGRQDERHPEWEDRM